MLQNGSSGQRTDSNCDHPPGFLPENYRKDTRGIRTSQQKAAEAETVQLALDERVILKPYEAEEPMDGVPSLFDDERARQEIAEIIRSRAGHLTRGAEMADGISSWEISALWERVRAARVSSDRVGEIPPEPPTLRGRMGAWLIRSIRRALFWYTPRIAEFQHNASRAIEQEARAIDQIVGENKELRQRVGTLVDNLAEEIRARKALETWTREEVISLRDAWPQALERNRSELQEQTERCLRALEARLHAVIKQEQTRFGSETRAGFRALEDGLLARIAAVRRAAEPIAEQVAAGKSRMDSLEKRLIDDERTMFSTRTRLLSHEMRISVLIDQARKRIPEMSAAELAGFVKEERQKVDDLYLAFENQFRGQREDLKDRMRVYLPILKEHGIGHEGMRLLDVGCGRGEWLELLRENGIEARGVDASRTMVQHCRQFNLPVVEGDAITFLRSFETGSLGGIS